MTAWMGWLRDRAVIADEETSDVAVETALRPLSQR